jgi:hypothetical protein
MRDCLPEKRPKNNFKITLALFLTSGIFTLHFAFGRRMGGFGATDNCSPRWAQD